MVLLLITACSKNSTVQNTSLEQAETAYDYLNRIDKKQVEQLTSEGDFIYDITNSNLLIENSTHVFIAKVKRINSATCSPYEAFSY